MALAWFASEDGKPMRKLEDLQRALSEGRIDRRKFIKQATALGMVAAIPLSVQMGEAKAAAPKRGRKAPPGSSRRCYIGQPGRSAAD